MISTIIPKPKPNWRNKDENDGIISDHTIAGYSVKLFKHSRVCEANFVASQLS
jgi:hypothetical protein